MLERSLAIVKPDGVAKGLIGRVIREYEKKGLRLIQIRITKLTPALAEEFYAVHKDRPFFKQLIRFMCSGPICPMVWEGEDAIEVIRHVNGATNPTQADWGTIRRMFADDVQNNIVHASDSIATAGREVEFYFPELADHPPGTDPY